MKKKLIIILGVVLAVYAAGELTNSELPTLSSLTDLTQIDSGNAAGVLADPLDGSMTITSADLNAKFKAVEVLLAQAPSGGGSAADIDYSLCNTYSVTHTSEGVELTASTDATGLASVFQLSECSTMGCDVNSFRSACVDGGGCADSWGGGNPLNDDGAPGLCGTIYQDGFNFYGTDCTVFTNQLACNDSLSLGVDQFNSFYDCRWAESGCFDVSDVYTSGYCSDFTSANTCDNNSEGFCEYWTDGTCNPNGSHSFCSDIGSETSCLNSGLACTWDGASCYDSSGGGGAVSSCAEYGNESDCINDPSGVGPCSPDYDPVDFVTFMGCF